MKVLSRLRCRGRHNVVAVGVGIESPYHHLQSMHCTTPLHPLHIIYIHLLSVSIYPPTDTHHVLFVYTWTRPLWFVSPPVLSLRPFCVCSSYVVHIPLTRTFVPRSLQLLFLHCNGSFGVVNLI
ncbi:hypothetical protein SCLCIDRAFT_606693 [Scleroderma citrinum Foug A]|uniref:Uncharacterized protein n=1 Tax=Scleroderma citrinum Foug A TaxID=1036808 RepID=A0A0C2YPT6_9AGAM|nr:hypothetical protein SCLCIDRAFT_606693 [Scleroderma citrinum Foug A]